MSYPTIRLKKNEDRRIKAGHLWIYSNEIDIHTTPIKHLSAGEIIQIESADKSLLGLAYLNPKSLITARVLTRNAKETIDADFFEKRIKAALTWRERTFTKPYYRMVYGESDGLPGLVVDRFNEHLAVQLNTVGMDKHRELIIQALRTVLPEVKSILLRNDSSSREQEGLPKTIEQAFGSSPEKVSVEENDTTFEAPFLEGQKTGWFYDHRLNRLRMQAYAEGKRVLDVFSYLGGWGLQAAQCGASSVTCLDVSKTATDSIVENAKLNNVEDKVRVICEDAFIGLKQLLQAGEKFDIIILDPPAFVKKFKDKKEGLIAYQRLNEMALKLLNSQGLLFSCSCSMHVSEEELIQVIRKSALKEKLPLQIVERGHQGQDHPVHLSIPETNYLKMILVRLQK